MSVSLIQSTDQIRRDSKGNLPSLGELGHELVYQSEEFDSSSNSVIVSNSITETQTSTVTQSFSLTTDYPSPQSHSHRSNLKNGNFTSIGHPTSPSVSFEASPANSRNNVNNNVNGRSNLRNSTGGHGNIIPTSSVYTETHRRGNHQRFPSTGQNLSYTAHYSDKYGFNSTSRPVSPIGMATPYSNGISYLGDRSSSFSAAYDRSSSTTGSIPAPVLLSQSTSSISSVSSHRRQPSVTNPTEYRQILFCPFDGTRFVLDEHRCIVCGEERPLVASPQRILQPWKKILYEHQGYDDNYTDRDAFLMELRKNVLILIRGNLKFIPENVQDYSYSLVLFDSFVVTQQISIVALFASIFFLSLNSTVSGHLLGLIDIITSIAGFITYAVCHTDISSKPSVFNLVGVLRLFGYGIGIYVVSPVLAALTDPISDDTITTLSMLLLIIHLSFQDYGYLNSDSSSAVSISKASESTSSLPMLVTEQLYHAPVSLNAAIFASLMMASRLDNYGLAFGLIAFAILVFALFPIVAHKLKAKSWSTWAAFLFALIFIDFLLLHSISKIVCYSYLGTVIFATFISPFCLQWIQRYKNQIKGPWDEAVPAKARRHGTRED